MEKSYFQRPILASEAHIGLITITWTLKKVVFSRFFNKTPILPEIFEIQHARLKNLKGLVGRPTKDL